MISDSDVLERQISEWRTFVGRGKAVSGSDVEELEGHLRDHIEALTGAGLAADEAFLVATKRIGSLNALSAEFAREHSERLWRQLVFGAEGADAKPVRTESAVVLALALAAALAIKIPGLFGVHLPDDPFYARNVGFLVLPFLTAYLAWKRGLGVAGFARCSSPSPRPRQW